MRTYVQIPKYSDTHVKKIKHNCKHVQYRDAGGGASLGLSSQQNRPKLCALDSVKSPVLLGRVAYAFNPRHLEGRGRLSLRV